MRSTLNIYIYIYIAFCKKLLRRGSTAYIYIAFDTQFHRPYRNTLCEPKLGGLGGGPYIYIERDGRGKEGKEREREIKSKKDRES